jgi:hypothetical protein
MLVCETSCASYRTPAICSSYDAGKILAHYTDTGLRLQRNNFLSPGFLSPGALLIKKTGGFFLCTEDINAKGFLAGFDHCGGLTTKISLAASRLFDYLAQGDLDLFEAPASQSAPNIEPDRVYALTDYFFTIEKCGKSLYALIPENNSGGGKLSLNGAVLSHCLDAGCIKPLPGPLFRLTGVERLPAILLRYKTFEDLETGAKVIINKISKKARLVDMSPRLGDYNTCVTYVLSRRLVPFLDIQF